MYIFERKKNNFYYLINYVYCCPIETMRMFHVVLGGRLCPVLL